MLAFMPGTELAEGTLGRSGSETLAIPALMMRLACGGAPPVFFFFASETLCSSARLLAVTAGGPPWKVTFRLACTRCTM